ncbi:uncharacterized protein [Leptinotarsa decemlineata]|uniref:uncharacterized protein n=1 Tax=Leptinotarsa decemlineata TaxID=7539 RepID=UPI003D304EE4
MKNSVQSVDKNKLVPPDGGWGYIVTVSIIVSQYATVVPLTSFGILYGPFMASIGDEKSGISMLISTFVAVSSLTGFVSSFLLRKYTTRMTGLIGATCYFIGYCIEIFGTTFSHMLVCFGFIKGFGYGLLTPSLHTTMNNYFSKKLNLMMGISQAVTSVGTVMSPPMAIYLMENLGFKKTLGVFAGFSILNFPAVATFRNVEKYQQIQTSATSSGVAVAAVPSHAHPETQVEPLLQSNGEKLVISMKSRKNNISSTILTIKNWLLDTIGLRLLGNMEYINMAVVLSLPFVTDGIFLSLINTILNNMDFKSSEIALMMMIYFFFDVLSKLLYSALSGFYVINNRNIFLVSALCIALFRIAFILIEGHTWRKVVMGLIGISKGFQETSLPLVISSGYKEDFSTAYSLYMVISGISFLLIGSLISYLSNQTQNDSTIIYVLAVINFVTCFTWISERIFERLFTRKSPDAL